MEKKAIYIHQIIRMRCQKYFYVNGGFSQGLKVLVCIPNH